MATIADVAQRAGVSIATVSRVLSPAAEPHPVRPETAERVRLAAAQLGYVASPLARGLAAGRSGLIGLVVPDLADPHYPQIASGVEEAAHDAGMAVLVCNTLGDTQRTFEYVRLLHARRVDAIVLSGGTSLDSAALKTVEQVDEPVVLIGRPAASTDLVHVSIDNALAARLATWHLVEGGWRPIVHLGGPRRQTTMVDRAAGYQEAMHVAGLAPEVLETSGTPEDGYAVMRRRLEASGRERLEESGQQRLDESGQERLDETGRERLYESGRERLDETGRERVYERGREGLDESGRERLNESGHQHIDRSGRERLDESGRERPRGVFAATDRLAIAAIAAITDAGLAIPIDIAVIGFDDIALAEQLRPRLSSVAQPAHAMGRTAFELAQRLLAGERVESVTLQARLVVRGSSAR
ncbi:MAG: substrate-binding domain-containing protein [Chloroflexi bacterium]|nr:substrate-binding domain-containing protein [Chloroflexota bacterium]